LSAVDHGDRPNGRGIAAADRKRWMKFLRKALGQSDDDSGHGVSRGGSR
jgi:hypothetical protein